MATPLPLGRPTAEVIVDPIEVESFLRRRLGFGIDHCRQALTAGHARAALATLNSALGQFGSDFYFGVIEEWRNQLLPLGFEARCAAGLELARRTDNAVQVTTCMATAGAGDVAGSPQPKNPKGASSQKAVRDNQGVLGLLAPGASWDPVETWWLLYQVHGGTSSHSITAELSLPNWMTANSRFDWQVRLILPTLTLNDEHEARVPEPAAPVEVPIVRRSA